MLDDYYVKRLAKIGCAELGGIGSICGRCFEEIIFRG